MPHEALASWDDLLSGAPEQALLRLQSLLDESSPADRVALLRRARPKHLERLFELCRDQPLTEQDLVPGTGPGESLHDGINSLAAFRAFQKRFFRSPEGALAGYNPGPFNWATTPGYFVVRREGEHLLFDYTALPREVPSDWPPLVPNRKKLGRFVYYGLRDDMRRVSSHVCVGAVARHGQPIDTWFALARRVDTDVASRGELTSTKAAREPDAPPPPA